MSESYHSFASVYDNFMDNIPYFEWTEYLISILHSYNIFEGNLLELGCGTANMSIIMADKGYNITGIDNSIDMLTIAADKTAGRKDIFLVEQDMTELNLTKKFDSIYSLCDSMNYILTDQGMIQTFKNVDKYLMQNGIFVFDLKTEYYFKEILGDQVFCDHQESCSYTWENSYFEEDHINQYELTIFVRENDSNLYKKYYELHHQKSYDLSHIISLLKKSGLRYLTSFDAFTTNPPNPESERIYIIAGKGE